MAEQSKRGEQTSRTFKLDVPLDASGIDAFKPEQGVKVLVVQGNGQTQSKSVQLNAKGIGLASFTFRENPGALLVIMGPDTATDEELRGLQTIRLDISSRQWGGARELKLPPVLIKPFYWFWWLYWCQTVSIRGRVICPDGSPVPGAKVCAYDVDWWFIWSSTQLVGCDTTDVNGTFEIKFRWCCGWWPWWWWRYRVWQLDPILSERVSDVLRRVPEVRLSPLTSGQPSLAVFKDLLAEQGLAANRPLAPTDVNMIEQVRSQLLQKLPTATELANLHIWPWWPWGPWWDCTPDIIFKVTQDCLTPGAVIVDEGIGDTRWNIPNPLSVTLVANEKACCLGGCGDRPCPEGECMVIARVCGFTIDDIGGNPGAPTITPPPRPAGYLHPGAVLPGVADYNGDRPFAGTITVENANVMLNVDYYEIEHSSDGGTTWNPLPPGAAVDFNRKWMDMIWPVFPTGNVPFQFTNISGHNVVESREHYEATNPAPLVWNLGRFWIANRDVLVLIDSTKFSDNISYHFRVVGWQLVGGNLQNRKVLPICGTEKDNNLILTFDNQVLDPMTHDSNHNCGLGVHNCTQEPDTHIIEVRMDGVKVNPCATAEHKKGTLEIDFLAHDPDGHLGYYSMQATYGLNLAQNLLNQPSSVITPLLPGTFLGPTYGEALGQGATAPHWKGGKFTLTMNVLDAFPIPCCYQLELRAYKRTVVGCDHGYAHNNLTEFTLGVGVCPPAPSDR